MILKNGSKETVIEMSSQRIAVKLPLRNKDQSGDSTATDTTSGGTKAKILSVSGQVTNERAEQLKEIIKLAEAETETGARVVYTITDKTADVADIRQVIFTEDLDAREIDGLGAWAVTFSLREVISVPELKNQRRESNDQTAATINTGDTITGQQIGQQTENAEQEIQKQQGAIYTVMKSLDQFLAPEAE